MSKHWIVVAHRAGARIFSRDSDSHGLVPVTQIEHPTGHLHEREFGSDRPGRDASSARPGAHAMTNETPGRDHDLERFARVIAEHLRAARVAHDMTSVVLVAEPHLLGVLRAALDDGTATLVRGTLAKDLVHVPDRELPQYLADAH